MSDVSDAVAELTAACEHVRDEREALGRQARAFRRFQTRVTETDACEPSGTTGAGQASGWISTQTAAGESRCRAIRAAFDELVVPHVSDETSGDVRATIAAELSEELAVALASEGSGRRFSPLLKQALLEHTAQRVAETRVMVRALEHEVSSLERVLDTLKGVAEELPRVSKEVLILNDAEELWSRHQQLDALEARLQTAAESRQSDLGRVTAMDVKAGIRHDSVVEYLYADRSVSHPALAAIATITRECRRRGDAIEAALE